uniref:Actin maturation protease n=1 Tax=Plectus sambesii TaxID=2011161 RepID=A0A914UJ08_9BILA
MRSPLVNARVDQVLSGFRNDADDESAGAIAFLNDRIVPVAQDGPQCGLVALKMAADILGVADVTVERIFQSAKASQFTNNGEMFSVEWMAKLAEEQFACSSQVLSPLPSQLDLCHLLKSPNTAILVPYDNDKNFEPTFLNGHAAHWSILVGFVAVSDAYADLKWLDETDTLPSADELPLKDVFLFAFHGKSKHPGLWQYDRLKRSNENLAEFGEQRANDGRTYILPPERLDGLRAKCLILRAK